LLDSLLQEITNKQSVRERKWFKCNFCDHQASTSSGLTMHIQAKQEGIRYSCEECGHQFTQKEDLNYPCYLCDYAAKRKDLLKHHVSSVHGKRCTSVNTVDTKQ